MGIPEFWDVDGAFPFTSQNSEFSPSPLGDRVASRSAAKGGRGGVSVTKYQNPNSEPTLINLPGSALHRWLRYLKPDIH
jgi:hypothetical protein